MAISAAGFVPSRAAIDRRLGRCSPPIAEPRTAAGPLVTGHFASAKLGRDASWTIAYPPGHQPGDRLRVLLLLHGAGWGQRGWFGAMRFHRHLADAVASGAAPFALAAVDGGPLFWHPRAGGADPLGMLTGEFLPLLAHHGLLVPAAPSAAVPPGRRIAVLGCSMGGYGALLLAETWPGLCAGVFASSPAVWDTDPGGGAFDSAADFARHDVLSRASALRGQQVRIWCGASDPLRYAARQLADRVPTATLRISEGCHDPVFWEHLAPEQLHLAATALT
ncbi:MAG: hypothetical protein QOJ50_2496 [Cryptosporangiaceae bacterium]|nr:hypothetical protein [Cryptosporangiaceae bacterium]